MTSTVDIQRLQSLPLSERREALESIVISVLKKTLLMDEDEPMSTTDSFFDMGLTSLGLTEAKQQLETLLDCGISATVLFNSPTVERLTDYLADEVLPGLFKEPDQIDADGHNRGALWDDVMRTVCEK